MTCRVVYNQLMHIFIGSNEDIGVAEPMARLRVADPTEQNGANWPPRSYYLKTGSSGTSCSLPRNGFHSYYINKVTSNRVN